MGQAAATARTAVGRHGENLAARALLERGWRILARNWRCGAGEIDIVAVDGDELVAVEVKTRRSRSFGAPAEAVTRAKLARLRRLAAEYAARADRDFGGIRVDVIAVELPRAGAARVEHLEGVT